MNSVSLDPQKERLIREQFAEFDQAQTGKIPIKDARLILRDLDVENPNDLLLEIETKGMIKLDSLLEVLRVRCGEEKFSKDTLLIFDTIRNLGGQPDRARRELSNTGKRNQPNFKIQELLKAAHIVKEPLTEQDARDMMEFADFDNTGNITFPKFAKVMRKTSLW